MWLGPNFSPDKTKRGKTIVSLVPSLTELLFDLGLGQLIIGRTKFCLHPAQEIKQIQVVGGTKNIQIEKVRMLKPDIIIANKEENTREDVEALSVFSHVYLTDISNVPNLITCIQQWIEFFPEADGHGLMQSLSLLDFSGIFPPMNVAYLIWYNPLMTIGHDTFIHYMLTMSGLQNIFREKTRYPETSVHEVAKLKPDVIFLSSEPFPFSAKHQKELEKFLPSTRIVLVDGEMFSWYGSRILSAPAYFRQLAGKLT